MPCNQRPARNLAELREITRRHFFAECGVGVGKMALASLLVGGGRSAFGTPTAAPSLEGFKPNPLAPRPPHFPAKVKRVIYLFMVGAPSQLDLFEPKPTLVKFDGQPIPSDVVKDARYAFIEPNAALMSSRYKFHKRGECGMELSEMLPHLGEVADEISLIRSMHTDQFNHRLARFSCRPAALSLAGQAWDLG